MPAAILLTITLIASLALRACGAESDQLSEASPDTALSAAPETKPTPVPTPTPSPEPISCITLAGGEETEHICGLRFVDPGCSAQDRMGRDMTERVTVEGEVCSWEPGEYELSYSFCDDEGNEIKALRKVTVVPAFLPETSVKEKVIYLTFDDGPCKDTPEALEVLAEYDAKATFFVITGENKNIDLLADIASAGHSIGIHCNYHRFGQIYPTKERYFKDLMNARETVFNITGEYPVVVRFPGGSTTAWAYAGKKEGGVKGLYDALHNAGMREYDWNIQPENDENSTMIMYYTFTNEVPKHETPIVLQHDTRLYSIRALRQLLEWGTENGYTFLGIDCTVPEVHQEINESFGG